VVRVSVRTAGKQPLAGAGIRVTRDDNLQPAQFGVTTADGEAMVALAGLPFLFVSTGGAGDVIETRTPGKIAVFLHEDGVAVTPDMMRANDGKLVAKGDTAVQLGAGVSLHHLFTVSP